MNYLDVAVLLVTLTQIIIVSAYIYLSSRIRNMQKEINAAYPVVAKTFLQTHEQELKLGLLLKMHDIEVEGLEIATSAEEAISMIFESMGESAEDLKPEDFN